MAIESLKLNSAPSALFASDGDERNDVIAGGRLLLAEEHGKMAKKFRPNETYEPRMSEDVYRKTNENLTHRTLMFCAKVAAAQSGKNAPENYAAFLSHQREYMSDPNFLRCLSGIVKEVISPLLPYTTSNALGELAFVDKVAIGQTYEVTVKSNDIFMFQDSSWGASRSVPKNYLYDGNVTINPQPRSAAVKVKWYQLVGNQNGGADIGRYYMALAGGLNNKILALWNAAMTAATSSAKIPAYLKKTGYTTPNWISLAKAVSQANGVDRTRIIAYGDWLALSKVLPEGTTQDAALTYQLGREWFAKGYLGTAMGVPMVELTNAYAAGTVNLDSATEMLPTNTIYMVANAGDQYAPVYIIYEDDPIVLEMTPDRTGDASIDVNMTASVAAEPVLAGKMGVMSSIA